MFTHMKVRTGMLGVLVAFVISLLIASLNGWYSARVSDRQIKALNLLTAVQLDKLNNAAIWTVRASATSHSAMLDRLSGKAESADQGILAAKERLANGQKLVDEILPTVQNAQLRTAAQELQTAFVAYGRAVLRQIDSTRAGDLSEYVRINDEAKSTSLTYAKARETFTDLITRYAQATMVESEQRLYYAQASAVALIALTVLLAAGCWWFIARRVLAPLREAGKHFDVMASGDLSQFRSAAVTRSGNYSVHWRICSKASAIRWHTSAGRLRCCPALRRSSVPSLRTVPTVCSSKTPSWSKRLPR